MASITLSRRVQKVIDTFVHPRTYEWVVQFTFGDVLKNELKKRNIPEEFLSKLDFILDSFKLPSVKMSPLDLEYKGSKFSIPTRSHRNGTIELTIKEVIITGVDGAKIYGGWTLFTTWIDLLSSAETGLGLIPKQASAQADIILYNVLGTDGVPNDKKELKNTRIRFYNMYPTKVSDVELSSKGGGAEGKEKQLETKVDMSYNFWRYVK